jgi:chromosomal replication initiation ATPase DnaA
VPPPPATEADKLWQAALTELAGRVTRANFETWLGGTVGLRFEGAALVVGVASGLAGDWCGTRMSVVIAQALAAACGGRRPAPSVRYELGTRDLTRSGDRDASAGGTP